MSDRTYSEREIADLIARAAERQQDASRRTSQVGLTLSEVERIGQETGIDPAHLRAAAAEMDAAGRTLSRQSGHTRTHITVERWIDAPLTPEAWEETVAELRGHHGADAQFWMGQSAGGTIQQVGNAYEWSHTSSLGVQTTVTASPRGRRTRLRLRQLVGVASPTAEGVGYGFLVALIAAAAGGPLSVVFLDLDPGVAALVFAVVWVVAAPLITALDRRWRAGKLRDLESLADDLAPLLAAPVGETMEAQPMRAHDGLAEPAAPRLNLDASGDAPADENSAAERRRQQAG